MAASSSAFAATAAAATMASGLFGRRAAANAAASAAATSGGGSPGGKESESSGGGGGGGGGDSGGAVAGRRAGATATTGRWGAEPAAGSAGPAFGVGTAAALTSPPARRMAAGATSTGGEAEVVAVVRDTDEEALRAQEDGVAAAPRNAARKVQTLQELQRASDRLPAAAAAAPAAAAAHAHSQQPWQAGIDLGLLTNALSAPEALEEPDEVWAFSRLLNALDQQLTRDKEEAAAADAKSGATVGAGAKL